MVRTPGLGLDRGERFCTPLAGSYDVVDSIEKHFAEDDAADRLKWVMGMPGPVLRMQQIFSTLNSTVFISRFGIASRMANLDVQVLKETNQCQLDMTHAFDMSFASIQRTFLSTAAGLDLENEATQRLALRHSTRGGKDTAEHTSFNFFGIVFILTLGAVIIAISLVTEPAVLWHQKRWNLGLYARLDWHVNHKLYLQRLAHEELGFGEWHTGALDVPITKAGDYLGVLDVSDPSGSPRILSPAIPTTSTPTITTMSTHTGKAISVEEGPSRLMDST